VREGEERYVESIGDNSIFFIFYAFGDLLFFSSKKK